MQLHRQSRGSTNATDVLRWRCGALEFGHVGRSCTGPRQTALVNWQDSDTTDRCVGRIAEPVEGVGCIRAAMGIDFREVAAVGPYPAARG